MTKIIESNILSQVWKNTLALLSTRTSSHNFESWFKDLILEDLTEEAAAIGAADEFKAAWVTENYLEVIIDALEEVVGHAVTVTVRPRKNQFTEPEATQIILPNIRDEERMAPLGSR